MDKKAISVGGNEFSVPGRYQQIDSEPDDPEGSIPLITRTEQAMCFVIAHHIDDSDAMPYEQETVINAVHGFLQDSQGIIEAESGKLEGKPFVYSIVKNLNTDEDICPGVQYILAMDIAAERGATHFQGQFNEIGTTGMRDSLVFELCRREGLASTTENGFEGWSADPYDPNRTEGALMNLSEAKAFDAMFPEHPLSMARKFVSCILGREEDEETNRDCCDRSKPNKDDSMLGKAGKLFGNAAHVAGGVANTVTGFVGNTAGKVADVASEAASVATEAANEAKNAIGEKIEEAKAAKDEPDEYDLAVITYNQAHTSLNDAGITLYGQRIRAIDLIRYVEALVNSIANHPKSFDRDMGEITEHRTEFKKAEEFVQEELTTARASVAGMGAGIAAGMAVARIAPNAAMWVATTFGTASTGAAISTLSGAAATNAALAWLGGGTLAAGGGGMAAGGSLLALAGPIGWGIAGATLLTSIALFTKRKFDLRDEKQRELTAVKENTARVSETAALVNALLSKTISLHDRLDAQYIRCMKTYGADYSKLDAESQNELAAMVNNTLSLSRLISERINQDDSNKEQ